MARFYITTSNYARIVKKIQLDKMATFDIDAYDIPIYFFSKKEKEYLKALRNFFMNPDSFCEYYVAIPEHQITDSYQYVNPENKPSYHKDSSCSKLHLNYVNFRIPQEIRERGKDEIIKFRKWFNENKHLLEIEKLRFVRDMQFKFMLKAEFNMNSLEQPNSGIQVQRNYDIRDLQLHIEDIIRSAGRFFRDNPTKQNIIRRYSTLTAIGYIDGPLTRNESGLSDNDLKLFLREYDTSFKKPVKELLKEYYRLLYNPEMLFEGSLLEKLNFKPCSHCIKTYDDLKVDINSNLPF